MDNNSGNSNPNNPPTPSAPPANDPTAGLSFNSTQSVNSQNFPTPDPINQTTPQVNPTPQPDFSQPVQPSDPQSGLTPTWQPPQEQSVQSPTPSSSSDINLNTTPSSYPPSGSMEPTQPAQDYSPTPPIDPNSFLNPPQNNPPITENSSPSSYMTTPPNPPSPDPNPQNMSQVPENTIQPSWEGVNTTPTPAQSPPAENPNQNPFQPSRSEAPPIITEQAPTDLSHLITDTSEFTNPTIPTNNQPETLVASSGSVPETPSSTTTTSSNGGKGIPKWIFGLGVGLLLAVSAASAYFILGVGQSSRNTSLPATTQEPPQQVKPPPQVITPTPSPQPQEESTASGSFGDLDGAPQSSTGATSAAELLRQRQR